MKTLNPNILQKFILVFCLSLFAISCTTDSVEEISTEEHLTEKQTREREISLSDDKDFISLTLEMYNYASFLEKVIDKNSLNYDKLQNELTSLQNEDLGLDEQSKKINNLFNYSVSGKTLAYSKEFSKKWNIIKERYGNIKQDQLESSFAKVLGSNIIISGGGSDGCNWRYFVCMGAAYAGAIFCDAGCTVGTLGIGAPGCIILCGIILTYAGVKCNDAYCY